MIWDILEQTGFNNYFQEPQVQTLTVQTLLVDENIITQFKNLNPKLIEYVQSNKQQFISKLIYYTIVLPLESDSQDRIKKLPYVSSELLAIDNQLVYKSLLQDAERGYFCQLMRIFDSSAVDNQILMGYFAKIIQNLYKCEKKQVSQTQLNIDSSQNIRTQRYILQASEQVVSRDCAKTPHHPHIDLRRFHASKVYVKQQEQRKQVIQKVIGQLVEQQQAIKNVCKNILVEVVSKFQTFSSGDQLLNFVLCSQKILQIFQLASQQSQSVDLFLVAYLAKALQKICTTGQQDKSLMQISGTHKQKIKTYIKAKKIILNSHHQDQSFKNQTNQTVYRLDRYISTYLTLIKLSLQNHITQLFVQQDILTFFQLLFLHPSNDIIKSQIFQIFTLIYTRKDESSKQIFQKHFYTKSVQLFQKDKGMFGYFLFQMWKNINKRLSKQVSIPTQLTQRWDQLLKYFQMNENYAKEAQKVIDRYSNRTKVIKLVVDQQDNGSSQSAASQKQQKTQGVQNSKKNQVKLAEQQKLVGKSSIEKKKQPPGFDFSFDKFRSPPTTQPVQQNKVQTQQKVNNFADFQFFKTSHQKKEQKKQQAKKVDFSGFQSFF